LLLVLLVASVVCVPFVRTVYSLGPADEGVILLGADRLMHGDRLYTDFFEFLPPASFVITAGWFAMLGTSLLSARCLAILVIAGTACLIYLTCRQVSRSVGSSAFFAITWLLISPWQGTFVIISHHWFATLFSIMSACAAFSSLDREHRRLRSPLLAGLAGGAAAMVTPTRGVAATLAAATAYLDLRHNRVEAFCFLLGCAIVPLCTLAYLVENGALLAAYADAVVFPAKQYLAVQGVPYGDRQHILLDWLFPVAGLLTLATVITWRTCLRDPRFRTCIAFGLAGWFGFAPRPDVYHIFWSAPLICPLISYSIGKVMQAWRPRYFYLAGAFAIALWIPFIRATKWDVERALGADLVSTPRGEVSYSSRGILPPDTRETVEWLAAAPQGGYFFYPYNQMLAFLAARQQVSAYDLFTPDYTTPEQYWETCMIVMRRASWVVIDRSWTPSKLLETFPGIRDPSPPEVRTFEKALDDGFEPVKRFSQIEVRRRRPQTSDAACADISH
jgi:hypothetical protein